jgi:hypothetical protein
MHPGQLVSFTHGPARLDIQGENQPYARWDGQSKTTKEGVEFFFRTLNLDIAFPEEWLSTGGRKYLLRLSAQGFSEQLEMPLSLDDTGKACVNIGEEVEKRQWKARFTR